MATAIENNPIVISLTDLALSSGWTIDGSLATHSSCNAGNLYILNYPLTIGQSYTYTYDIQSISGGYVEAFLGTNHGAQYTTPQFVEETVVANGTQLYLYSNANCVIDNFAIGLVLEAVSPTAQNTISYSEKSQKWVSFYTYIPDHVFALFTDVFPFYLGDAYVLQSGSENRNNFFGKDYQSIIQFVDNVAPTVPKSYLSLSLQSNELMVTGDNGISTSLGQISELAAFDFIKDYLTDGVSSYNVNTIEGVYSANFLRDKNDDLLNGTPLKGNYIIITLISTTNTTLLLYTVNIVARYSPIGSR